MSQAALKKEELPEIRGRYTENAPLGEVGWFRAGGRAEILFKPKDLEDLCAFLEKCPPEYNITTLGVLSNTIIRDGGISGVVIRLGRAFAGIEHIGHHIISTGAAALDANVSAVAAQHDIGGLEYLSGIPGSIGGALRMNAGAYGTETKDVLIKAQAVDRKGKLHEFTATDMGMSYRRNELAQSGEYIFTGAQLQGFEDSAQNIADKISDIRNSRHKTQPVLERTGGSTFANPTAEELAAAGLPETTKTWQLIDAAGGRELQIGGAKMSEKHCNFMINTGDATGTDLENLGEEIRKRVYENSGIMLRWEIRRLGNPANLPE